MDLWIGQKIAQSIGSCEKKGVNMKKTIESFLDEEGRIKSWPSKRHVKKEVLLYLGQKFEPEIVYTEKQVNELIRIWHTFGDFFLLRRELIDNKILLRTPDGGKYWKNELID